MLFAKPAHQHTLENEMCHVMPFWQCNSVIEGHFAGQYLRSWFCSVMVRCIFVDTVMSCVFSGHRPAILSPSAAKQTEKHNFTSENREN